MAQQHVTSRLGGFVVFADVLRNRSPALSRVCRTPFTFRSAVAGVMLLATSLTAAADVLDDWRAAAELGCPATIRDGAVFAGPGFVELPEDGIGRVFGAGRDVRAHVREVDGRRVCEVRAGGARVAPVVEEAFEAFLDWAEAAVATGAWRYGDAARERRLVPIAARIVSAAPNARGCGVEALFLADPYGGQMSLTVAETAGEACAAAGDD